jgi:protein N-terminal methyltransferase
MEQPDAKINQEHGRRYWEGVNADIAGMLGGFPEVNRTDLVSSKAFLAKLGIGSGPGLRTVSSVLEGGAGYVFPPVHDIFPVADARRRRIRRITKGLLLNVAKEVEVIEPSEKFTNEGLRGQIGVRHIFNVGLED